MLGDTHKIKKEHKSEVHRKYLSNSWATMIRK